MIKYKITEEQLYNPEIGKYISFGICAYRDNTSEIICSISDVFLQKEKAIAFVNQCNEMGLEVIHLPSVIENLL